MYDVRGKSKAGKIAMTFKRQIAVLSLLKNISKEKLITVLNL